jgi:hypothetical protein
VSVYGTVTMKTPLEVFLGGHSITSLGASTSFRQESRIKKSGFTYSSFYAPNPTIPSVGRP